MRPDIAKVVVERPRNNLASARFAAKSRRRKNNDRRHFEDAPRVQSMGRWGYYGKELTDFLAPLSGLLRKNVGRRWDDVYSEMRQYLNPTSTLQKHIFEHLWGYVERNAVLNDEGVPCRRERGPAGWTLVPLGTGWRSWHQSFFIHPTSGLLLAVTAVREGKPEPVRPHGWRRLNDDQNDECIVQGRNVYVRYNGIWFHVDMRPVPKDSPWGSNVVRRVRASPKFGEIYDYDYGPTDILLNVRLRVEHRSGRLFMDRGEILRSRVKRFYGDLGFYAHGRGCQLNTKTLRRLGVVNEPIVETSEEKRARERAALERRLRSRYR